MSQRYLTHETLEATTGWDRMLQRIHLTITNEAIPEDEPGNLLYDCMMRGLTEGTIRAELEKHGFPLPANFDEVLHHDKVHDVGNERSTFEGFAQMTGGRPYGD